MSIPYSRYVFGNLPWYGVLIVCGIAAAISLCLREEKRLNDRRKRMEHKHARLYYVIFQWNIFAPDPLSILRLWEGGLAIYGGVIGGLLGVLLFAKHRRITPAVMTDMIVPGLALAQSIGRWGNYFNMEAYGRPITNEAWQFFPIGVQIPAGSAYVWHMATFIYESCWDMLVFLLLWFVIRKRSGKPGSTTLCYLLLYGTGRFFIEGLRMDSLMTSTIRVSQLLSLVLVVISMAVLLYRSIRRSKTV